MTINYRKGHQICCFIWLTHPVFTGVRIQPLGKIICCFNQKKLSIIVLNSTHKQLLEDIKNVLKQFAIIISQI